MSRQRIGHVLGDAIGIDGRHFGDKFLMMREVMTWKDGDGEEVAVSPVGWQFAGQDRVI